MTFKTGRLPLAVYLHATNKLQFLRCDPAPAGRLTFIFDDPEGHGEKEELEFDLGAMAPAAALFASQTLLRKAMTATKATKKPEQREIASGNSKP